MTLTPTKPDQASRSRCSSFAGDARSRSELIDALLRTRRGASPSGRGALRRRARRRTRGSRSLQAAIKRGSPGAPTATRRSATPTCRRRARPATPPTTRAPRRRFAQALQPRPARRGRARRRWARSRTRATTSRAGLRLRRAGARRGARRREALRRDRRRAGRARPLRRGRAHAAADGRPEAEPRLLRARLLLPRAARRPDRAPSRRCGSPPPRAATRARTSPTCRRCSATSSLRAAASARRSDAYRLALSRYPEYVPRAGGARARRLPRAATWPPRSAATARGRRVCRCPST